MTHVPLDDLGLYVDRAGDGFPELLISGLNGLALYWRDRVPFLSDHFTVVTHDQRGFGSSGQGQGACTVAKMADDVVALMDVLGIGPIRAPTPSSRPPTTSSSRAIAAKLSPAPFPAPNSSSSPPAGIASTG